jgi:hypothetical protein
MTISGFEKIRSSTEIFSKRGEMFSFFAKSSIKTKEIQELVQKQDDQM